MAEKATPEKRVRFKLTSNPSAGTSAGDGGDDGAGAPASAPRRDPPSLRPPRSPSPPKPFTYDDTGAGSGGGGGGGGAASAPATAPPRRPSSSPPSSPSPPKPFTYNPNAARSAGGGAGSAGPRLPYSDSKDSDDEKPDQCKTENGWGSLFMSDPEVLSKYWTDPHNLPRFIGRQNCEPLSTQEFFSLHHNWHQLLDGKKTYLRCAALSNYADCVFLTPEPLEKAVRCQEPLSHLVCGGAAKPITQQKFMILSEHYVCFRPMRKDGSQFYRAFLFSYMENLGRMQGSQAEVTRLMECLAKSRVNFRRLKWNNAYFSNPEAFFSSVVSEFEHLVNSVANGLNADELYNISLHEISSSRILSLLRLLTEVHIRTYEVDYNRAVTVSQNQNEQINALLALSQALGIPLHLITVDGVKIGGTVQVKCLDIIPRSGRLSSSRRYYLSSATDKQPFLPPGNLFLSDCLPLVTILMAPNVSVTAVLYRK